MLSLVLVKRKKATEITLQEHMQSIAAMGGRARAAQLPPEQQSEIGRKAGLVGGAARAKKLSPAKRKAIAKKAAEARWAKKA
jgi:general stress protein YciG